MKDQLRTLSFKIYRLFMKNVLYIAPARHHLAVTEFLINLYFRSYHVQTKRADGRWVCLTRDEIGKILDGPDHKRFNKNNFYPVMREFVKPGSVAIDVGTSYGDEVIELSDLVGPTGRVYAFEPCSKYFPALESTVQLNGLENVTCMNMAVGAKSGHIVPKEGVVEEGAHYHYLKGRDAVYDTDSGSGSGSGTTGNIDCIALDSLAEELEGQELSFIKIDTDGFEVEVLKGAADLLRRHPECRVVAEFMPGTDYSGYKDAEVLAFYKSMGFKLCKIQMTWREVDEEEYEAVAHDIRNELHMTAHDIALIPENERGGSA